MTDLVRPPHVSPTRWYHPQTPWYARKQASDAYQRTIRPVDVTYAERHKPEAVVEVEVPAVRPTGPELVALVDRLINDARKTPEQVSELLNIKVSTLESSMRNHGRKDLSNAFGRVRRRTRKKKCQDCPAMVDVASKRCSTCANRETWRNAETRAKYARARARQSGRRVKEAS